MPNFSVKTVDRVSDIMSKLLPIIGEVPISEMTPSFLSRLRSKLIMEKVLVGKNGGKIKNSSVNRWLGMVTTVLNFSVGHQRIAYNPSVGFKKLKEISEEMDYWTKKECSEFLRFADKKYPSGSERRWVYCAYLLVLNTGLRAGELWGLKEADLKDEGCILVERQWLDRKNKFTPTKGKKGRKVPYPDSVQAEIEEMLAFREEGGVFKTLFFNSIGNPVDHPNFMRRNFRKDVIESEVREIRFHDLRHTALTLMVAGGLDIRTVQEIAGHSDIKTTMRYVHLLGESIKNAAKIHSIGI